MLGFRRDERLVVERTFEGFGQRAHSDEHALRLGLESAGSLDRFGQRGVEKDDAILGVIQNERDLIREEPNVYRVEYGADHRHCVVQLHVAMPVPGKRRDAVAGPHAKFVERMGEFGHALGKGRVVDANDVRAVARHDALMRMRARGMFEDRMDREWPIRHRT